MPQAIITLFGRKYPTPGEAVWASQGTAIAGAFGEGYLPSVRV